MPRHLPPLNSIRAFEAAARHLSFSQAAEELSVTQSAVSKQILILEDYIGIRLFERRPGNLNLTNRGVALKESVMPAFDILDTAFERYSRREPRSNILRLATLSSFAVQFLVPRLPTFKAKHPDICLEMLTSDRLLDLSTEEVDVSIRFGRGDWEGLVSDRLGPGTMLPVCRPDVYSKMEGANLERFVNAHQRTQVLSNNEWLEWAEIADMEISSDSPPLIIEDFLIALESALEGQSIALLPEIVVRRQLRLGTLVKFSENVVETSRTYYIAYSPTSNQNPTVKAFIDWITCEAKCESF